MVISARYVHTRGRIGELALGAGAGPHIFLERKKNSFAKIFLKIFAKKLKKISKKNFSKIFPVARLRKIPVRLPGFKFYLRNNINTFGSIARSVSQLQVVQVTWMSTFGDWDNVVN
jgi:hypothetical protein